MASKLWGGRFQKSTDALTDDFNASISFDARLYKQDIQGSMAHAEMLGRQGIITEAEADTIREGLKSILDDIEAGKIEFSQEMEDIHMNIESILIERIGDTGKKLHTGRSRNDQVATDMRLYVKEACADIKALIADFANTLLDLAARNKTTVMPGYTHLQRAQPVTFAHHLMAYVEMLKRDTTRFENVSDMADSLPLGVGALATTTYPLDRYYTAQVLGFKGICLNSMDAVSDRDYAIDFLEAVSVLMMHLSRLSEEVVLWCSSEFGFITLDDAFSTGSSIMPQKKNPDIPELIRGKTGRTYGDLMAFLTTMKGLPLAYNKDMQEDKEPVFDAYDTAAICLKIITKMMATVTVNKDAMKQAAGGGFVDATDAADWLVGRGVPFRDAHAIVGKLVFYALEQGKTLRELTLEEYRQIDPVFDESVYDAIDLKNCVSRRDVIGGPAPAIVDRALAIDRSFFAKK